MPTPTMPPHSKEGLRPWTAAEAAQFPQHEWDRFDRPRTCQRCFYEQHNGSGIGWHPCSVTFESTPSRGGEELREALRATKAMYEDEIAMLRRTLIAMGRMLPGVALHDDVSSSFLTYLPTELAAALASPPPVDRAEAGELERLREALQRIQDEPDHTLPIVTAQRLRNIAGFALLGERLA